LGGVLLQVQKGFMRRQCINRYGNRKGKIREKAV